jgi:hypothetical protein
MHKIPQNPVFSEIWGLQGAFGRQNGLPKGDEATESIFTV